MKKFISQISIGIICVLLGFMITYQFKMISKQNSASTSDTNKNTPEIITENEQLKKSKVEMQKKIDDLDTKTKEYETAAGGKDTESELLNKELVETRILTGDTDVKGEGMTIYITPKSSIFGSNSDDQKINDTDLVHIVNELNAADAEAISINDIRLTSRSGIRNAGNAIIINDERISYSKRITIKAIGKSDILESAISFPGAIPQTLSQTCDITMEKSNKVVITKSNRAYKFEFAKPIEKK
ncbi:MULTISPECIES: DUF881 domain-containing protein [Clostridium]|uniref:DUF881 domain-containing protein n=1 Tax=Clostridium frigoriphilum TaxID=443253 RepID=A0ABU7UK11_9CLOT|nr:DUF881 domain-containing protein [Clostridium sp. DSM 17811]MBU3098658.1 DUF881 domain-containing protein [Clostridium sp. DSM 17811]